MSLEELYFFSQTVAALALIGSLIFVAIQIKQARDAQRRARDVVIAQGVSATGERLIDPAISELILKVHQAKEELSDVDLMRYTGLMNSVLFATQATHGFWHRKEISYSSWKPGLVYLTVLMQFPAFRVVYRNWRDPYAEPDFRTFADELHEQGAATVPTNTFVTFRQEFAKEMASQLANAQESSGDDNSASKPSQ